ncbi:MAG: hypothetical protein ACRDO1_16120 [Nocardioidaceae bacterium]
MGLVTRLRTARRISVPIAIGVVALLLGTALTAWTVVGGSEPDRTDQVAAVAPSVPPAVKTKPVVLRKAGIQLQVPVGYSVKQQQRTARFVAPDKAVVITAGRGAAGSLARANRHHLATVRRAYTKVEAAESQATRVAGHTALITSGQATNSAGVPIRFVAVVLRGGAHNYAITAYTARDSDPASVLPQVNAVVNSFELTAK